MADTDDPGRWRLVPAAVLMPGPIKEAVKRLCPAGQLVWRKFKFIGLTVLLRQHNLRAFQLNQHLRSGDIDCLYLYCIFAH